MRGASAAHHPSEGKVIGLSRRKSVLLIYILIYIISYGAHGGDENDLWLMLSSYEDIGVTIKDLAFFLVTHGFDASPMETHVVVRLSGGEVYLTPNGASPRLADLWMEPPTIEGGPMMVIPETAVKKNATFNRSVDLRFITTVSRYVIFPVTPLGMCYDGSQQLRQIFDSFGYDVVYMYDPSTWQGQGHLWVLVLDPQDPGAGLAVDSYYGPMTDEEYYIAPYSFADFSYLDAINPRWKVA